MEFVRHVRWNRNNHRCIIQAIAEGLIVDDTVAIDATHFKPRDQAQLNEEKTKAAPKKRGRKSKEEREQWWAKQAEKEANLPLYEKKIEAQLGALLSCRSYQCVVKPTSCFTCFISY